MIKFLTFFILDSRVRKSTRNFLFNTFRKKETKYRLKKVSEFYSNHIKRIKNKKGKIKVGFLVNENQKWNCQTLYDELEKNDKYEPVILLTQNEKIHKNKTENYSDIKENFDFFQKKGLRIEFAYDLKKGKYLSLKKFNCDIIFFPQPWFLNCSQSVYNVAKYSLTAYVPYCFHMLEEENNYFVDFHDILWMYFVESPLYEKKYAKKFSAKNVFFSGHTKLDNYLFSNEKDIKNSSDKKVIIYAPHHYNCFRHRFITFDWNGKELLDFAKKHSEFEWIFKPHPIFKNSLIEQNIMDIDSVNAYFDEWEKIGTVYTQGDYYNLFKKSSILITDCISFLAEYMPTKNPVIFLKSLNQIAPFTELGEKITEYYYKVHNWQEFCNTFETVVKNNDDYLKTKRIENLKYISMRKSAAGNIVEKFNSVLFSE